MGTKCFICKEYVLRGCICSRCYNELFNHKTEIVKVIASAIDMLEEMLIDTKEEIEEDTLMINIKALRKAVIK